MTVPAKTVASEAFNMKTILAIFLLAALVGCSAGSSTGRPVFPCGSFPCEVQTACIDNVTWAFFTFSTPQGRPGSGVSWVPDENGQPLRCESK